MHGGGEPAIQILSILAVVAVAALALGSGLAGLAHLIRRTDPPDEPGSEDDRGGGNRRPDPPRPGGGGEPAWWPDFEREFENYVASLHDAESGAANSPATARARACGPPRRRTGDRRALRSRRPRRRQRAGACAAKRPR